jgi:membrane protease YdiL (CAAX protease family)
MIAAISIFVSLIGSLVLYRIHNSKQFRYLFQSSRNKDLSVKSVYFVSKLIGFILFGLIPGILVFVFYPKSIAESGLSFGLNKVYWYLFGIPFIIIGINFFLANNPATFSRYPEMRFEVWTKARLAVSAAGWTIYLLGYEFLFRGLLFFSVYHTYGLFASLTINSIIYSAVHIPKGKAEMIGAIPFGILLCFMSLLTNSILLPFLIHLSLALSTDFFSIHYNPNMKLVKTLKSSLS